MSAAYTYNGLFFAIIQLEISERVWCIKNAQRKINSKAAHKSLLSIWLSFFASLSLSLFLWLTRLIHAQLPSQEKQIIVLMNAQTIKQQRAADSAITFFFVNTTKEK